jgi:hypothetical protein
VRTTFSRCFLHSVNKVNSSLTLKNEIDLTNASFAELKFWTKFELEKGYDYIGAPWFEGFDKGSPDDDILAIAGNGGFSLRNIDGFIKAFLMEFSERENN